MKMSRKRPTKLRLSNEDRRLAAIAVAKRLPPDAEEADLICDEAKRLRLDLSPVKPRRKRSKVRR
jgi:hypothetical protein